MSPQAAPETTSTRRLISLLKPYAAQLAATLVMLMALALVNMLMPMFIKLLLDDVFPKRQWSLLWIILGGILAVYLVRNILYFLSKFASIGIGENVCFSLRKRLFERLQQMNLKFYRSNNPGQLSSRVMDDSFIVQSFIQEDLPTLMQAALRGTCLLAIIYWMNWQLALASTVILPLHLAAYIYFKRPIKAASRLAQEQISHVHGNLIEKILGAEVVKGFTGEARENETFEQAIDLSRKSQLKSKTYHITQKIVADLLVGIGTIALLGFGAYQVIGPAEMKPGAFIAFFTYVAMLFPTVIELMSGSAKMTKATASVDRVFEMLERTRQERVIGKGLTPPIQGEIEFQGVHFGYEEDGRHVLEDISIHVRAGEACAITGPSGSGKSTLISMLPRFNDPDAGTILLDGHDIRAVDLRHLRESMGIAFQECFLFNSSILENLRYARADATMSEIIAIARRTGAHEFITGLPQGYHTMIGSSGVSLSRGEKQRITLTRALLKNPKILILDESTASLDAASEAQIVPAILECMRGKTTIMITHRRELLRHCDTVVQIQGGRVVYQGAPEHAITELLDDKSPVPGRPDAPEEPVPGRRAERTAGPAAWRAAKVVLMAAAIGATVGPAAPILGQEAAPADAKPADAAPVEAAAPAPAPAKAAPPPAAKPASAPAPTPPPVSEAPKPLPAPKGLFLPQPGLNPSDAAELLDVIATRLRLGHGYSLATDIPSLQLPPPAPELEHPLVLAGSSADGSRAIRMGYQTFSSQPLHLQFYAQTLTDRGPTLNTDLDLIEPMIVEARKAAAEQVQTYTVYDLEVRPIKLSYIEADRCLGILKSLGYETIEYTAKGASAGKNQVIEPTKAVDPTKPLTVMAMPDSDHSQLVGGMKLIDAPTAMPTTSSAPLMQLMAFYHPNRPELYAHLVDRIETSIDLPATQILIEAMVLEISETGLDQLGVEWQLAEPLSHHVGDVMFGRLPRFNARNAEAPTVSVELHEVFGRFNVQIQALVREGKAEILSRPSILTLDNRQARISVGEQIPIATTVAGITRGDKVTFDFRYVDVGIELNVRPRVNAERDEVSMQITGEVSAEVPGEDLVVFDSEGSELVRAPRLSTRQVQTYSRIANNTPFIIGGLISRENTTIYDKVPLLGDIPLLGYAFRSERSEELKREVIIVITPFILPEERIVGRTLPEDKDLFDSFGNELFRDAYRIRAEDAFDLGFLKQNRRLQRAQQHVNRLAQEDADLILQPPYSSFANGALPGEEILVYRQMYEVIKRRKLDESIDGKKLIYFRDDDTAQAGFDVKFLWPQLHELVGLPPSAAQEKGRAWLALRNKAVAITFTLQPEAQPEEILDQPVPDVRVLPCVDSKMWEQMLWALNQPDEQGRQRYTILLRNEQDMQRLKRAVALRRTVELNASERLLTLENFSVGQLLLMPSLTPDKVNLIDEQVAKFFFLTEMYYPALEKAMSHDLAALEDAIRAQDASPHADHVSQ